MSNNIIDELLTILSGKIKKFEKELRKQMAADPSKEAIKKIIESIKNDRYAIANIDKKELLDYFSKFLVSTHELEMDEISTFIEERYKVTEAVARGYTQGIMIKYDKEDEKTVDKLIDYLERCLVAIDSLYNGGIGRNLNKEEFAIYYKLFDKLHSEKEVEFFTEAEIELIEELIADKNFEYYKQVMGFVYRYNRRAYDNRLVDTKNSLDNIGNEEEETTGYTIDENELKRVFDEYGFTLAGMPEDIYEALLTTCDINKIIDIFEFVKTNSKYGFLKSFGETSYITENDKGKKVEIPKNKTLIRREFVVLYQILRFSNKSILRSLLEDCEEKNIDLEELLLKVKGVVKHVSRSKDRVNGPGEDNPNDLNCAGTFENYKSNSSELIKLSKEHNGIDYLGHALNCETYTAILGSEANRFRTNIQLLEKYGYKFELLNNPKSVEKMPWMSILHLDSDLMLSKIDLLIENGVRNGRRDESFRYFLRYPSVVYYDNKLLEAIICKSYTGELSYLPNGKLQSIRTELYDVEDDFYSRQLKREELDELRSEIPEKYKKIALEAIEIDFDYSDEYLDRLEPYVFGEESDLFGLAYLVGDVVVSLPKVKRIWKAIRNNYNEDFDLDKLFMYALTYGSYYDSSELLSLSSIINGRKFD